MAKRKKKSSYKPLSDEAYTALVAYAQAPKSDKEKRFIKLGWQLMEAKFQYYKLDSPTLTDHEYDMLEREYDSLAKELGLPPTAADMVGFDNARPSAALVGDKVMDRDPPDACFCNQCKPND